MNFFIFHIFKLLNPLKLGIYFGWKNEFQNWDRLLGLIQKLLFDSSEILASIWILVWSWISFDDFI